MSLSQFHCTSRLYLDMHGLIFETSICYWQDQPGRTPFPPPDAAQVRPGRRGCRPRTAARGLPYGRRAALLSRGRALRRTPSSPAQPRSTGCYVRGRPARCAAVRSCRRSWIRDTLRVRENESPELAEAAPGRNTPRCPVTGLKCGADLGRATAVRGRTTGADGASRSRSA